MRASALIAAVGTAAVLGGVVGAAAMRVITSEPGQWWCSSHICSRDEDECIGAVPKGDDSPRMQCTRTRIAFCPVDGVNMLQCVRDWHICQGRTAQTENGHRSRCVGVE